MVKKEKATLAPTEVEPQIDPGMMAEIHAETAKQKRDFFAISAASGILAHHGLGADAAHVAKSAYEYADAMLAVGNAQ